MNADIENRVRQIRQTFLTPGAFFVSWHGVMTLAFNGFTEQIRALKSFLNSIPGLDQENSGSRWPKVSLGCLKDNITFQKDDFKNLVILAQEYAKRLRESNWRMPVDAVRVVVFGNRQLSKRLIDYEIELAEPFDEAEPIRDERQRIENSILNLQTLDDKAIENQLKGVNKDGGRQSRYEESHVETTLICQARNLPPAVDDFKKAVKRAFPGYYFWFDKYSLHMTIRALKGKDSGA